MDDAIAPKLNDREYSVLEQGKVSSYYPNDILAIKVKPDFSTDVEKGNFYSLIIDADIWSVKDIRSENKSKAVIAFYNLSDKNDLLLKANEKIKIFDDVDSKSHDSREINAAKVHFEIVKDGQVLAQVDELIIERGNHYSVLYNGDGVETVKASLDFNY